MEITPRGDGVCLSCGVWLFGGVGSEPFLGSPETKRFCFGDCHAIAFAFIGGDNNVIVLLVKWEMVDFFAGSANVTFDFGIVDHIDIAIDNDL